ncbi:ABC transporter permease subunit [Halostella sp. JP-L12]|uniref:ABC transporter permease subunit n=1 Tax=Halostella TaxID=1843185 RepID=UPI000EF822F0|nr:MULTISPECIES: ABC transporter permease subunit [Halostella]NHN46638.1 ABC transporter permease subunit [Halostella sp. JP-L12]
MSAAAVARKDFLDVRRAKIVWFVVGVYVLLTALFFVQVRLADAGGPDGPPAVLRALWNVAFVGAVFVPAVALVSAYLAVAGERESGSIKFLLSTPITRRDVVVGKYVSRAAVVAASLALAFAVAAALSAVWFGSLRTGTFAGIAALTTVYALAYVAVAIGISASTASRAQAMAAALGFYFSTNVMTLVDGMSALAALRYALNELLGLGVGEDATRFLGVLTNPTQAYLVAVQLAFPAGFMDLPAADGVAWYARPEVAVVVLLAWLVAPILFGLRRFERADIG